MGQQQLLLIILGVIIVAIAIAIGIAFFNAQLISSNKDGIIEHLNTIATHAFTYAMRPLILGGGDGSFEGYQIPTGYASNIHGTYSLVVNASRSRKNKQKRGALTIEGVSSKGYGTVKMAIDDSASVLKISYTGQFK
ncbi:MAG TPA: hypothetical protein VFF29_06320 [Bacteroidota bacterium]|nr:hypothetical protein [Bacteroidota bacterium]